MHTVELLDRALTIAAGLGYGIRHEWLGGATGGVCEIAGQQWLFVDLSLNPIEQLDQVIRALQQDARIHTVAVPALLQEPLGVRRAA